MSELEYTLTFEDYKNENGITYWWASLLMKILNYSELKSFEKAIDRATKAMMTLGISHHENIVLTTNPQTGLKDFKLTRFACYMVVMNADRKRQEVQTAIAYFAKMTEHFESLLNRQDDLDRLLVREEIKEGNKILASVAKQAGVVDFAKFQNAGYLGMYNMQNWQLAKQRNVDKEKLFEYMGRAELAANLFRITMTEEKIKNENITGQFRLEEAHKTVGREVRNLVIQNTGKTPEKLEQAKELPEAKKGLKQEFKEIKKIDKK